MAAKHTPGPWRVDPCFADAGLGGVTTADNTVVFAVNDGYDPVYMRIADAHLIAAAPDLLKALKFAREELFRLGWSASQGGVVHTIDATIAKAEGR